VAGHQASMYRYSRGQAGQGSLPRPAWGSGSHGGRAASPEPGGLVAGGSGTPMGNGGELAAKERLGATSQDEVILQLENELAELRNACAWKDQRIAELSRTDTSSARLKRDIRQLASELHSTRQQLSEALGEAQARSEVRDGAGVPPRSVVDGPSTAGASGAADKNAAELVGKVSELQEENRQLREALAQLKMADHSRLLSGASTQRASEPPQTQPAGQLAAAAGGAGYGAARQYGHATAVPVQAVATHVGMMAGMHGGPASDEPLRPIVYSTFHEENTATIGPTALQGVGTVDGVSSIAKILLQRIHSSVCAAHRRQPGVQAVAMQAGQYHGQQLMVGMPMG